MEAIYYNGKIYGDNLITIKMSNFPDILIVRSSDDYVAFMVSELITYLLTWEYELIGYV